jgi:2-polyprenyl-3-methyl-5-hydroxy-6-metoxy-1,4-benzoquinol methylase
MKNTRACWCGNSEFKPFSESYGECTVCGTLVTLDSLTDEQLLVANDETDFYGKQYWLDHQATDLGFPDIKARARNDLTERNLHWLKVLMKYRMAPADVLEIGCAHGSFVALLRQVGYQASGVEMSPWVVEFGKQTFSIPVSLGPVENLDIAPGSLDVIALMDVIEHLPDPVTTMRHCLSLLKPDGILLIQTPQFREGMKYDEMVASKSLFLDQLKSDEHLYLFSERSVTDFFHRLDANHIYFEPAIFKHYDMFFVVSRQPVSVNQPDQIESALLATPNGRFVLALLDLRERELNLREELSVSDADRQARLDQVNRLGSILEEVDKDRAARGEQIETLTAMLRHSEDDRAARAQQIDTLTAMVKESEADRAARGEQIITLTALIKQAEAARRGKP